MFVLELNSLPYYHLFGSIFISRFGCQGEWNDNDSSCKYSVREQAYKIPTFWRSVKRANNFNFFVDLVNHYIEWLTTIFCVFHFFPLSPSTAILTLKCFLNIWRLIQLFITKSSHGHNNSYKKKWREILEISSTWKWISKENICWLTIIW